MMFTASVWATELQQGVHSVLSLVKGNSTLYAQLGSDYCDSKLTPYLGGGVVCKF